MDKKDSEAKKRPIEEEESSIKRSKKDDKEKEEKEKEKESKSSPADEKEKKEDEGGETTKETDAETTPKKKRAPKPKSGFKGNFKPPTSEDSFEATDARKLIAELREGFKIYGEAFPPVPVPTSELDFLANNTVLPQSFTKWNTSGRKKIHPKRKTIYLMPIGTAEELASAPPVESLVEYLNIYFDPLPIKVLPRVEIEEEKDGEKFVKYETESKKKGKDKKKAMEEVKDIVVTRKYPEGFEDVYKESHLQYNYQSFNGFVWANKPDDAFCVMAYSMYDFFEDEEDEFVVGDSSASDGIGIFSFARYDPMFDFKAKKGQSAPKIADEERKNTILKRACKLLVSEIGRLLGIGNCVYHHCMMNGTGHLNEDLSLPLRMCPVDLRKVFHATEHPLEMLPFVTRLHEFYAKHRIEDEEQWTKDLIKKLKD